MRSASTPGSVSNGWQATRSPAHGPSKKPTLVHKTNGPDSSPIDVGADRGRGGRGDHPGRGNRLTATSTPPPSTWSPIRRGSM